MFNFSRCLFLVSQLQCELQCEPNFKSEELCQFSKRQEVDEKEMKEFRHLQTLYQNDEHIVMGPTKELCPARA